MAGTSEEKQRQRREVFVREYCVDLNGTRAAIAAGFGSSGAAVRATELLQEPEVVEQIDAILAERVVRLEIKGQRVLETLYALVTFDVRAFYDADGKLKPVKDLSSDAQLALAGFDVSELYEHFGKGQARAIGTVTKIRLAKRTDAAQILVKYLPDLKENAQKIDVGMSEELAALAMGRKRIAEDGDTNR